MTLIATKSSILFSEYVPFLTAGTVIATGSIDMEAVDKYQYALRADAVGLNFTFQTRADVSQPWTAAIQFTTNTLLEVITVRPSQRYVQYTVTNNTGVTVSNVSLEVKVSYGSSEGASVAPLDVIPQPQTQAVFVQAVIRGQDTDSIFRNLQLNQAGAALVSEFGTEVARGLYQGYDINVKFGRNPDVDPNSTPEDMWNGSVPYTGFNATQNENMSVASASASDTGTLITSGTATGGTLTSLVNTGATFITSGVQVGDLLINDTKGIHGTITSLTETQLNVFTMYNGSILQSNDLGNSYRIARATGTGAAVLEIIKPLDANYEVQVNPYVILNGTTPVIVPGNYMRTNTARVVKAGSAGLNIGEITVRQATTTANIFCVIPTFGRSAIGCFTVPANKQCLVKRISCGITRASGAAGSALILFNTREFGGAWNAARAVEVSTSTRYEEINIGALVFQGGTDIKFTIQTVSDTDTRVDGEFEYYLINV